MRLAFHAHSTSADANEDVASFVFEGPGGRSFGLMNEDGLRVRMGWHDGMQGEDEAVVGVAEVRLARGRLSVDFDRQMDACHTNIPYEGVDITYDDLDDRSLDLVDVFQRLLSSCPGRIRIVTEH